MPVKPLISQNVTNSLNTLVQKLFMGNRLLDRIMTNLSVSLVMPKTESILHPLLAHKYPLLADQISGYMESRNQMADYLETPTDTTVYDNLIDIFNKYLDYQEELEEMVKECIEIAKDEDDISTKVFLESFLLEILKYTNQAILLCDKAEMYGEDKFNRMLFDEHIESFIIPELRNGE